MYEIKEVTGISAEIRQRIFALQDESYRPFMCKLMPNINPDYVIGVRSPAMKSLAKELKHTEGLDAFLADLPHGYFEENNLHGLLIGEEKDYDLAVAKIDALLPYVDNWATSDGLSPKAFKKNRARLREDILRWIESEHTYTVRFAIGMVMAHFLDEDFDASLMERVSRVRSEEYYINMMTAWYFATALAKQWEATIPYIENQKLDRWTHNKAIQKAVESYRITPEQKDYLRTLRVK